MLPARTCLKSFMSLLPDGAVVASELAALTSSSRRRDRLFLILTVSLMAVLLLAVVESAGARTGDDRASLVGVDSTSATGNKISAKSKVSC